MLVGHVRFGSLAASQDDISLMSASERKADITPTVFTDDLGTDWPVRIGIAQGKNRRVPSELFGRRLHTAALTSPQKQKIPVNFYWLTLLDKQLGCRPHGYAD